MAETMLLGPVIFGVAYTCDWCGADWEQRIFTDSHTDMQLCLDCVIAVAPHTALTPREDGDNLTEVLDERRGPQAQPTSKE